VPFPAAGVIPWLMTRWAFQPPLAGIEAGRWIGALMIAAGLTWFASAMSWFAREGVTPYPPIDHVVTTGPYAYSRNPMYSGALMMMAGQALLLGSRGLIFYAVCWFAAFVTFDLAIDDPILVKRFGKTYEDYLASVPAWIPRRPRAR